jgi:hypothetical protein
MKHGCRSTLVAFNADSSSARNRRTSVRTVVTPLVRGDRCVRVEPDCDFSLVIPLDAFAAVFDFVKAAQ